jgi:hypothetical protein
MKTFPRISIYIAILLLSLFTTGCGTSPLLMDKSTPLVKSGTGLVYCSFSYREPTDSGANLIYKLTSVTLVVRKAGDKDTIEGLNTWAGWSTPEVTKVVNGRRNLVSAISLPVGEYEIVSREVRLPYGLITYTKSLPLKKPFRFTVQENQAIYLGGNEIVHETGLTSLGHAAPNQIRIMPRNQFDDDLAMLIKARPESASLRAIEVLSPVEN